MKHVGTSTSALERLKTLHPEIVHVKRGLPDTGGRPEGKHFSRGLKRIDRAYRLGNEVYKKEWAIDPALTAFNSGKGSPILYPSFPPAMQKGIDALLSSQVSRYPFAAGDSACRSTVANYFSEIGFLGADEGVGVTESNIIFFNSTTEAFSILLKVICRSGDVVLFTAPTYGLFCYVPERLGAISQFLPLRKKNNWLIDPEELEFVIRKINVQLNKNMQNASARSPRVVAFLNLNPCNPTGLVMGKRHKSILQAINDVCLRNGVFLIDDIIYRDLCYNTSEPAIPIATLKGAFSNTITLFGTSKSFGLAGARAGGIVADEAIIRGLRNEIFQLMDSSPLPVSNILAGAFQTGSEYRKAYKAYFSPLLNIYKANWNIVKVMIQGVLQANCRIDQESILLIRSEYGAESDNLLRRGICGISIAGGIEPESGFFALVDFSALLGKHQPESDKILNSEMDIFYYFYQYANVKLLTGASFAWPIPGQVVARLSFAYDQKELIRMLHQIDMAIHRLW